jgi:hypothetical protein
MMRYEWGTPRVGSLKWHTKIVPTDWKHWVRNHGVELGVDTLGRITGWDFLGGTNWRGQLDLISWNGLHGVEPSIGPPQSEPLYGPICRGTVRGADRTFYP